MEISSKELSDNDTILKYLDSRNRIVEIAFLLSGNGCTIQYVEPPARPDALPDERIVRWSTGHAYRTWTDEGKTKFTQLPNSDEWYY